MRGGRRERDWTPDEDALIERPTRPLVAISQEIQRTVMAIYNRRAKMGWTSNPPPPHRVAAVTPLGKRLYPQRTFAAKGYVKPQMLAAREAPTLRRDCLSCRATFVATRFIYLCDSCKKTDAWRTAL